MYLNNMDNIVKALEEYARYAEEKRSGVKSLQTRVHEMSAVDYERERERFDAWCNKRKCSECDWRRECHCHTPLRNLSPVKRVMYILTWADAHPEG